MNYQHDYHAGGFADVLKHIVLITLIETMQQKETPFCYFDTHAGSGCYDLQNKMAKKTKMASLGVEKIMNAPVEKILGLIKTYCEIVNKFQYPYYYPGSPLIAKSLLRKQDRALLFELEPSAFERLKQEFKQDPQIALHHQDGYLGLKAFLPPKEGRGLILIDPAFELKEEWANLLKALKIAKIKFPMGIYAIWYPLKDKRAVQKFIDSALKIEFASVLNIELSVYPAEGTLNLIGSGMLIFNPPWKLEEKLKTVMPWLWNTLSINKSGHYGIEMLI